MSIVKDREAASPEGDAPHPVYDVRVFVGPEGGRWSAVAIDFTIVGEGSTQDEALHRLCGALASYLNSCARDGLEFEEMRRPISRQWYLRLRLEALLGQALALVTRRSAVTHRARLSLPDGLDGCLA